MTPTFPGRIQTRIFATVFAGGLWTLIISPVLPGGGELGDRYQATFFVLAVVLSLGLVWECVYHAIQQFRWEKDWPTFFMFLTGINEGIVAWFVVQALLDEGSEIVVGGSAFAVHFPTTWIAVFLFVNGPMRVPFLRWRYRGGRIV
ncbi:MAG: hypothetical protein HYU28_00835 [Actinobacteria bacterium]|nr:hypothetical protein [Actinomycetota bacterium]